MNVSSDSYFVFRDPVDVVRALSGHVLAGRAARGREDLPRCFVLAREV